MARRDRERRLSKGNHGYDPARDEMQATFLARGPRLPASRALGPKKNVPIARIGIRLPTTFHMIEGVDTGAKPGGFDLLPLDTRIGQAFFECFNHQVRRTGIPALAELAATHA